MTDPTILILLGVLGAWAALDSTAVGQVMISRPLVTGTLAGTALGDPQTGLLVGGILEAAHLGGLPVGGARLPEPGPAAIPGVLLAIVVGGAPGLAAGAGLSTIWSLIGGASVYLQRRINGWIMTPVDEGLCTFRGLSRRHWACIALDGGRGATLTLSGVGIAMALSSRIGVDWWRMALPETVLLLLLPGAISGGALLRAWSVPRRRSLLFLLGAIGGLAFVAAR